MKLFLKYFLLGLLGLVLTIAFPHLKIHWLVIVIGLAYLEGGITCMIPLSFFLALAYHAYSLANPLGIVLPFFIGILCFQFFRKNFTFNLTASRLGLLAFLWLSDWIFWSLFLSLKTKNLAFSFQNLGWGIATVLVGALLIPYLGWKFSMVLRHLSFFKKSTGELDYFRARHRHKKPGMTRKPFGFEKGI